MSQQVRPVLSGWSDSSERCSHLRSPSLDWVVSVVSVIQRWGEYRRACSDTAESPRDVRRSVGISGSWSTLRPLVKWSCCVSLSSVLFAFDYWLKRRFMSTLQHESLSFLFTDEGNNGQRTLTKFLEVEFEMRIFAKHIIDESNKRSTLFAQTLEIRIHEPWRLSSSRDCCSAYIPGVWKWFFQIDDTTEDEGEHGSEVLLFVGANGDVDETFRHSHTFVEVRCFQDRSFTPETELNTTLPMSTTFSHPLFSLSLSLSLNTNHFVEEFHIVL